MKAKYSHNVALSAVYKLATRYKHLLLATLTMLLLASCEHDPSIPNPSIIYEFMPIYIIQTSSPEGVNYVLASKERIQDAKSWGHIVDTLSSDTDCYVISGGYGAACQETFLGTNPYFPLGDNYYAVDWKWGNFVLYSDVLLNLKWEDVTDIMQTWNIATPTMNANFVKLYSRITYYDIDNFLGILLNDSTTGLHPNYSVPRWFGTYHTLSDASKRININQYLNEVSRQDSLQQIYIERLRQIVSENGIEQLVKFSIVPR